MAEAATATPESTQTPAPGPDATFRPFVPPEKILPELTVSAVVLGAILGIIFGASSLYLFLKVGMTVSASIPVAVLSITLFRGFSKAFGTRPGDDPGEQHRPDGRLGGRVDRLRRGRDDAGADDPGLRHGHGRG